MGGEFAGRARGGALWVSSSSFDVWRSKLRLARASIGSSWWRFRAVTRAAVDSRFCIRLKELWAHSTFQALPTCGMASVQRAELTFQVIKAEIGRMSSLRHVREGLKAADHHLRQESKRQVAHCRE